MQISKIQQPPIFAQKLQISIKSDFPNRFFNFLQECVQEGVYFGAHMVLSDDHFFKVVSGLQMAWGPSETSLKSQNNFSSGSHVISLGYQISQLNS